MGQMTWHMWSDILHRALVCGVKKEGREACACVCGVLCAGEVCRGLKEAREPSGGHLGCRGAHEPCRFKWPEDWQQGQHPSGWELAWAHPASGKQGEEKLLSLILSKTWARYILSCSGTDHIMGLTPKVRHRRGVLLQRVGWLSCPHPPKVPYFSFFFLLLGVLGLEPRAL